MPPSHAPTHAMTAGLSAEHPAPPAVDDRPEKPSLAEDAGPLVLVVDDDLEVCTYLRMCLKPITQHVLEAGDGGEALHLIRTTPGVRLVISDIVMPHMDGIALRAAIKADPALRVIPVLLITGESFHERDGPVLRKPFNARTLRAAVHPLLAR